MAIFIDVKSRFDDASGRKAAEEAKGYFGRAGDSAGREFSTGFAKAVERDDKVKAAADKVADQLDKITVAETKRQTQQAKAEAITKAISVAEEKHAAVLRTSAADSDEVAKSTAALTRLKEQQVKVNNQLVTSSAAVSKGERDKARAIREAADAYRTAGNESVGLKNAFDGLGASLGSGLKLNLGLTALGTLPAAATAITNVAGALQQLAGAGLAVPGIMAGIGASAGTAVLGMQGMADAFEAVNKASDGTQASVDAANKALAGLGPNAADTIRTVTGLKGTFTELRDIASQNMFAGVSEGLTGLVGNSLPEVTRGIDGISKGLNKNILQVFDSLGSDKSQGFLDRILGNTGDAQSKLTDAINPIVSAMGTLTAAGSDTLPRLATAIGAVAERFDKFITTADENGNLDKWINEGLDGFTSLGNTLLNIGKAFTGITEAAGGGAGLLATLEASTGKLATFLNSTEGQSKLKDYFAQGRDMLSQLKDVASSAGPVLAGVFQAGISAANLWLPVIKQGLDVINKIPGGAEAVVTAFVAWKSISGVASLATGLTNIVNLLKFAIPSAAATGAAGVGASFGALFAEGGALAKLLPLLKWGGAMGAGAGSVELPSAGGYTSDEQMQIMAAHPELKSGADADRWMQENPKGSPTGFGGAPAGWIPAGPGPGVSRQRRGVDELPGWGLAGIPTTPAGVGWSPDRPATPALSGYTPPVVTEGAGGAGADATPYIDPSKFMMGDPLAGLPAAVAGADPAAVYNADSKLITAANGLEQKRLALQVLEAEGNATQQQLLTAKNDLQEQERSLYDAQNDAIKARTAQMKQASSDMSSVFVALDQDFGASGGIPGIVENLTRLFGNLALAGAIGSSPSLQAAAFGGGASAMGPAMLGGGMGYGMPGASVGGSYGLPAGTNTGGYGSGGKGVFPDWVQQVGAAFGVTPSTYSGHQESDRNEAGYAPNPGHENRGIDWTGSPQAMQSFADYLKNVPGMEQVIWNGAGQGTGDNVEIAGGRSQPGYFAGDLAGHGNHVHTRQSQPIPLPGGFGGSGYSGGTVPVNVVSAPGMQQWSADWNAVAQAESGGNWSLDTGNGYQGGLQFAPSSWASAGGTQYAPSANLASPFQQAMTAENLLGMQGPGAWPNTFVPGNSGPSPTGAAPGFVGAGYSPGGPGMPAPMGGAVGGAIGGPAGFATGVQPAGGGGGGGGGGIGLNGDMLAMAGGAADLMAPGSSVAIKLANRAIQFGGQAAAIGVSGLMETFLPAGSPLAGNSWFSKLAGGIAGARPATPNKAGGPNGGAPGQQPPPMPGAAGGPPPGMSKNGGDTNITVNNNRATEEGTGKDIAAHQMAMNTGPMR